LSMTSCWPNAATPSESSRRRASHEPCSTVYDDNFDPAPAARPDEQAAVAAVDQACRRLRLPTIRAVLDEALTVAAKEQLSYQGSWPSCCWPSVMTGTGVPRSAA
jgi:hypothetical protein